MLSDKPIADLINETNRVLVGAVNKGIEYEVPAVMRRTLENDVFVFSGCKTYVELKEVSGLLWDMERNQVKSFDRFWKDVSSIDETYNKRYLEAEYQFAVGSAQSAARWAQIEEDGDEFDLQYRTAGDSRVREDHAMLEGTTLPPSDDFWSYYMPPNGWNCRCEAIQVIKGKYKRSNSAEAVKLGNEATEGKNEIFRFNPGKEKVIFPPHHPYYKVKQRIGEILSGIKSNSESVSEKLRTQRTEIREWAKESLVGSTVIHRKIEKPIQITNQGIKEALNQPHKNILEKNDAIKEIPKLIKESEYVGKRYDEKRATWFSYLKTSVKGEDSWIILKENQGGDLIFYSIVDKIKE
jgi:SPP1 gp7 family putative phage head morphogenesis protein